VTASLIDVSACGAPGEALAHRSANGSVMGKKGMKMSPFAVKRYASVCLLVLAFALTGCEGKQQPSSTPTAATPTRDLTPFYEEPVQGMLTAESTPTSSSPGLPDLTSPLDGWIAFKTPEEHLALLSADGSRRVPLTERGEVRSFAWSPDGRWLAFTHWGQLILVSIERSRFIPLTPPGTSGEFIWSQDSHHLAYLHSLEKGNRSVAPDALRILDIATRQAITVSTYSNTRPDERAILCHQPFPFPLLPVMFPWSRVVQFWDSQAGEVVTEIYLTSYHCHYLWLPETKGVIFAKEETQKAGIKSTCLQAMQFCMKGEIKVGHPTSLAVWLMGDEAPTVVLEGTQKQHYHPTRWLPDGRLEVQVSQFEKTAYEGPAYPEHVTYRYFDVTGEGLLREAESGDLPWWAAGGFQERFKTTNLYQEQPRDRPLIPGWEVGPDGETVTFAWSQQVSEEEWESAIYLWRGEGEPSRLTMGSYPQWQPKVPSP